MRRSAIAMALLCCLVTVGPAIASPTAEFEAPYAITVLPGGEIIEISGSFSWAVPQNLIATLAHAPRVRTIRFDSPGGYIKPALQVAQIISARGLDTYVPRLCASACTVAFLGGKGRFVAPEARLGFHQAHAPGVPATEFDPLLRAAYQQSRIPAAFIDHVLRTPPDSVWFPTQTELQAAGVTTAPPPGVLADATDPVSRDWWLAMRFVSAAPDEDVVATAKVFQAMLQQIQAASPNTCWAFLHNMPADLRHAFSGPLQAAMATAEKRIRDATRGMTPAPVEAAARRHMIAVLVRAMRANGQDGALDALRPSADHALFCPAMRALVETALRQPPKDLGPALRAVLSHD